MASCRQNRQRIASYKLGAANSGDMNISLRRRPAEQLNPAPIRWELAASLGAFIIFGAVIRVAALDQFPPGLHFDEAVYGLLARDILEGARPVFFSAWTGREPLYMYLMAGLQAVVGVNTLAIRLTSVLIGLATLPLTYLLGRELFNRRVALLATGLIAVNYWHLTVSRNGYPNILIPPLEAISFYFLWRAYRHAGDEQRTANDQRQLRQEGRLHGWSLIVRRWPLNGNSWLDFLAGGLFAGLVLYTYLAARFYPITLAVIAVCALIVDRQRLIERRPGVVTSVIAMIVVAAPLAVHFIRNPSDFVERADQVLIFTQVSSVSEGLPLFLENVWQTALAFFMRGDPRWHYNLPGKPIFDPLIAIFFVLGIIIALRRWRKLPYAAILIWTAVMCLPGILTADLQPAGQRMFGVLPALVMLPALGLDVVWRWIDNHRPQFAPLAVAGLVLLFGWEGYSTTQTYFGDWARRYETYEIFNGDYAQMAGIARDELAAGHTVVFVSEHYKHPTLAYLAPETMRDAVWTLGERGLVFPARGADKTVYLVPRDPFPPGGRVDRRLQRQAHTVEVIDDFAGRPAFTIYRASTTSTHQSGAEQTLNNEVRVIDAEWPGAVARDAPIPLTIRWEVQEAVSQARTFAVHLVDEQGLRWAQTDEMSYLSEQWHPGDQVEQWFTLSVDPTTPAGTYTLQIALTDEAVHPLPVLDEDGTPTGVWLKLGKVTLTRAGGRTEDIGGGTPLGSSLQVLDHSRVGGSITPGSRLMPSVVWQKIGKSASDQPVQIEFVEGTGEPWLSVEQPIAGQYPPSAWQVGEVARALYAVTVPADAPTGQSSVRLRRGDATLTLGHIDIQAVRRLFAVPDIESPLRVRFGEDVRFLGYDLPETDFVPGDVVPLTLYWQALRPMGGNYKVFTHLLGPSGQVRGQKDRVPASGARPTTGWVEGEIIIDEYEIPISPDAPTGTYQIEIGLYDARTIVRLPAVDAGGAPLPNDRVLLPHELQIER